MSKKPKLTVITPTVRELGLKQVRKSLNKQTFKDFEWIVISPNDLKVDADKVLKDPPKKEGDYWSFNKAMNLAIEQAAGDLIVSIQDFTEFGPEGLAKFWYYFENGYDKALISGVGDKYNEEGQKIWTDPRRTVEYGTFYECFPNDIEFNYCSIPRRAFFEVGGFDEYLDKYAGMDHISVQERLNDIGYKFYLDQTNESKSLHHGRLPNWDDNHAMHGGYHQRKQDLMDEGIWPHLDFLKESDV
jgi:glycosyltransferase involved in cell wall biosynthesis